MRIEFSGPFDPDEPASNFNAVRNMVLASGLAYQPAKAHQSGPRLSGGPSLAKGLRAKSEYADIYLQAPSSVVEVRQALQAVAPEGVNVVRVWRVPYGLPSVQNLMAAVSYRVSGAFAQLAQHGRKWQENGVEPLLLTRRALSGRTLTVDVAPFIRSVEVQDAQQELIFTLQPVQQKWMKPQWVVCAWLGREVPLDDTPVDIGVQLTRETIFWQDSQGVLHPI